MRETNAILTIAYRDFTKLIRDRARLLASFIFPIIFIFVLGGSLQQNIGDALQYNYLLFVLIGVIAQTAFQSTAQGIISLIQDRENDFSQEIFVSPVSRYSIIIGKLLGESLVSMVQVIGIIVMGLIVLNLVMHIPIGALDIAKILPATLIACLFGGSFGLLLLANSSNERTANQIFPFIIFPQLFLSGVFTPVTHSSGILGILTHLVPMTYAVDLVRSIFYWGRPEYSEVVLYNPAIDLTVVTICFLVFSIFGTILFTRNERNR